jgi:ribulose-phosphate 3-epimerase
MKIIPAILTDDLNELIALEKKSVGLVDRIQIDVIDNKFANNITIDPSVLRNIQTNLNLDFHLMVKSPVEWISHCIRSEASAEDRVIGQIEFMESQKEFVNKVISSGNLAGLAIDLPTPLENLDQSVLTDVDVVLLLSVKAGAGGQEFNLDTFEKIKKLIEIRKSLNLNFKLCIDGGITKELMHQINNLGVDEVVVGKRIFEPDLKQNLEDFSG